MTTQLLIAAQNVQLATAQKSELAMMCTVAWSNMIKSMSMLRCQLISLSIGCEKFVEYLFVHVGFFPIPWWTTQQTILLRLMSSTHLTCMINGFSRGCFREKLRSPWFIVAVRYAANSFGWYTCLSWCKSRWCFEQEATRLHTVMRSWCWGKSVESSVVSTILKRI